MSSDITTSMRQENDAPSPIGESLRHARDGSTARYLEARLSQAPFRMDDPVFEHRCPEPQCYKKMERLLEYC